MKIQLKFYFSLDQKNTLIDDAIISNCKYETNFCLVKDKETGKEIIKEYTDYCITGEEPYDKEKFGLVFLGIGEKLYFK